MDREIAHTVESYGIKNTSTRMPEIRLPLELDNFADALSGGTWSDSTTAQVVLASVADPANIEALNYTASISGPRYTNIYVAIRLPENDSLSLRRVAIGSVEGGDWQTIPTSAWTQQEQDGGYRYFTTPIADLPASAPLRVQDLAPFEVDHEILGINELTDQEKADIARLRTAPGQGGYVYRQDSAGVPGWRQPVRAGSTKLLSGPGAGLAITANSSSVQTNLQLFRPTPSTYFDLDTEDTDRFLFASVAWALSNRSSTAVGFEPVASPPGSVYLPAVGVHLDDVLAAAAYSASAQNGFRIHRQDVWFGPRAVGHADGSNSLGVIEMWIAKEATTNRLGYYFRHEGGAASGNQSWSYGSTVRAYL